MTDRTTPFGDPIGFDVRGWTARPRPPRTAMVGRYGHVEPVDLARHADELYAANRVDPGRRNWTYLASDGFDDLEGYRAWLAAMTSGDDPLLHAIVDGATGSAVGVAAFMRIEPAVGENTPSSSLISVVFPPPLGPMRPSVVPFSTCRSIPDSTGCRP